MEKPALFIASSAEGFAVASAINLNLDHDVHPTIWTVGTFKLGSETLGDLLKKSSVVDFAVFVFTPDDVTSIRSQTVSTARDNVVFELGLFIGALGRERCYIVKPRNSEMHLPSDLAGVTTADYVADRPDGDISSALNAACTQIRNRVKELGPIPRAPSSAKSSNTRIFTPNPAEFQLVGTDLDFLAECVKSHVAYPTGLSFNNISGRIKGEDYLIALSALKLTRMGCIEKLIEVDDHGDSYFTYSATENGLDLFLKHESDYAVRRLPPIKKPGYPPRKSLKSSSGFDEADDDIPF